MNNIKDENIKAKAVRKLSINSILFLPFFLGFLAWIFIKEGFGVDEKGIVSMTENVYLYNFLDNILFAILFIVGVVFVLLGMVQGSKDVLKRFLL